jgi:hypothetical protein
MNMAFALDYIPRRMKELGYGENYLTRYRQVSVSPGTPLIIEAYNQLLLFVDPLDGVIVQSKRGKLNLNDYSITEQQHEHNGKVTVTSGGGYFLQPYVTFIQVIPLNPKKKKQ